MAIDIGFESQRSTRITARRSRFYRAFGKRALDLTVCALLLPLFLPLSILIAGVLLSQKGSILYGHERVGRGGTMFRCWKFRSMAVDADAQLANLLASDPEARKEWAETQKLSKDPRITRFGHLIRKTSLDELPQFWNILRGDMSLVGPRPIVAAELEKYGHYRHAYLALRPGLTGLWQVSGRNQIEYKDRVLLDTRYFETVGFRRDAGILFKTPAVVVQRTGI